MLRVDTAIDGSFCRCRKGSPLVQSVPETMFTFCPATWARAGAQTTASPATPRTNSSPKRLVIQLVFECLLKQGGAYLWAGLMATSENFDEGDPCNPGTVDRRLFFQIVNTRHWMTAATNIAPHHGDMGLIEFPLERVPRQVKCA